MPDDTVGTRDDASTRERLEAERRLWDPAAFVEEAAEPVDGQEGGAAPSDAEPARPPLPRAQNPCLTALRLAGSCEGATRQCINDRVKVARLREAELLFEFVASGLLHCADRDATSSEASKGFNIWQMGKLKIQPRVARDLYVTDSVDYAAEHDCKVFISQPLVYEHLHEVFWPSPQAVGEDGSPWLQFVLIILFNIAVLPLLPFVPRHWEKNLEQFFRDQPTPLLLVWLLPSGRFFMWLLAMICLANLVTAVPPQPLHFEIWDVGLVLYLVGIVKAEFGEAATDVRVYGQIRRYLTDAFNVLDMLLVLLLGTLLLARYAHVVDPSLGLAQVSVPAHRLLHCAWPLHDLLRCLLHCLLRCLPHCLLAASSSPPRGPHRYRPSCPPKRSSRSWHGCASSKSSSSSPSRARCC